MLAETRITGGKKKFKNATLVVGLPGIGLVSKLAVDHAAKLLKAKRIATAYSPHFPNQTLATKKGKLKAFTFKFNHAKINNKNVIFLRGDLQPLTVEGQYELSFAVLELAKRMGVKRVFSMAGYAGEKAKKTPLVYCAASDPKTFRDFAKVGAKHCPIKVIPIVGMAGLLPALAPTVGLTGACLLVQTTGEQLDAKGAKRLLSLMGDYFNGKLNAKGIDARVKLIQKSIAKAMPKQQTHMQAIPAIQTDQPKADLTYIR